MLRLIDTLFHVIGCIFAAPFLLFARIVLWLELIFCPEDEGDPLYRALKNYNAKTPDPGPTWLDIRMKKLQDWSYGVLQEYEK